MELVFKKDCFLNKLFACIFIAMFILMCILGAEVSATDNENNELVVNGITFVLPEYDKNTYKYSIIFKTAQNDADKDWYCFAYSDKPFFASSYDFITGDPNSPYRIVSGQINPYSSTGLVNFTSNCYFTSVYLNSSNICDYSSSSFQNSSVTNFLDYVVYSSDTIYLLNKNDNQYFADTSTSVFPLPPQQVEETTILTPIVQEQEMKPLEEIIQILPMIIIVLVGLIAIRKAIQWIMRAMKRTIKTFLREFLLGWLV